MSTPHPLEKLQTLSQWSRQHPDLKLLVLFGSRARGDHDPSSDWDFAFLTNPTPAKTTYDWVPGGDLLPILTQRLQTSDEKIDLIDLSTCSDILAHYVARDGQLIYERDPGEFARFQQQALKTPDKLHQFRQTQRQKVLAALERWGV